MTDEQQEMVDFLEELAVRVRRGDVVGLAMGVVRRPGVVQVGYFGHCREHPLETIGTCRMMARTLEDHLSNKLVEDAPPAPRKTRK